MRNIITIITSLFLSLVLVTTVNAATLSASNAAQFGLNQASPGAMAKYQLGTGVMKHSVKVLKATFDFAVLGGAVGTYTLRGEDGKPVVIPQKAIVVNCLIDVITQGATAASGTIAIGTGQAANDLKAALAAASYTGLVACVPVGSAATSIKMTADRTMTAAIATGAITAGKFNVLVHYIISE